MENKNNSKSARRKLFITRCGIFAILFLMLLPLLCSFTLPFTINISNPQGLPYDFDTFSINYGQYEFTWGNNQLSEVLDTPVYFNHSVITNNEEYITVKPDYTLAPGYYKELYSISTNISPDGYLLVPVDFSSYDYAVAEYDGLCLFYINGVCSNFVIAPELDVGFQYQSVTYVFCESTDNILPYIFTNWDDPYSSTITPCFAYPDTNGFDGDYTTVYELTANYPIMFDLSFAVTVSFSNGIVVGDSDEHVYDVPDGEYLLYYVFYGQPTGSDLYLTVDSYYHIFDVSVSDDVYSNGYIVDSLNISTEVGAPRTVGTIDILVFLTPLDSQSTSDVSSITDVWSGILNWFISSLASVQGVFVSGNSTDGYSLTLLGTLSVIAISVAIVFLVIGVIQRFLKLRS